jgi:hypothetical protein
MVIAVPASAQMVIQAESAILQPQMRRGDDGFRSCGVRAIVMDVGTEFVEVHDFSIMVDSELLAGTLKAGKLRISKANMLAGKRPNKAVVPAPVKFWIARESEGKAITPKKSLPAETPGFILEISDFVLTYEGIMAMIHGDRMQFATRYKDQPLDAVISFSAQMPAYEREPLLACLNGILERLKKEAPAK